ncbi:hypothetical protein B296_00026105 [Ensete ventricosum]|uniref:Uncharacterized protein n=1 Tax=Ensete ventricosum TaxID=4639 RepID=A0A426YFT8_ENSVE|nr:hypothetical protein B296_00026105 [Ensete ventricosum]
MLIYFPMLFLQEVSWGSVTLVDAEKRLLANALLDFSNERFVLLSESCIPVYNFPTVYEYLIKSAHSFVESYDENSQQGRGRYSRRMFPTITLHQWRKGSEWFELNRELAVSVVADFKYYSIFGKYCKPSCYPDEHYIPTFLNMFHGSLNANRTVTWVDWSRGGPHPATYGAPNITPDFIQSIRNNGTSCMYNSRPTSMNQKTESTSLRAFLGGCTPCGAVQYNPRRPEFGLLLCVSSRCHVGTDTVIVLTPRGYLPSANPAQPVGLLLIATHLDLGCAGGRKLGESTMDERIPSPAYFQYSPSGVHSSPSPHHSIRSPASSDRERSATPPPCCAFRLTSIMWEAGGGPVVLDSAGDMWSAVHELTLGWLTWILLWNWVLLTWGHNLPSSNRT